MIRSFLLLALLVFSKSLLAEPVAELEEFSAFPKIDLEELAKGKVVTARSPAMSNARHLSVQACYIVEAPVLKTVELLKHWDAARHPQLKVYLQGSVSLKPGVDNFTKIATAPAAFIEASQKMEPNHFQIGAAEAQKFSGVEGEAAIGAVWSKLLAQRATAFVSGGLAKQAPYENGQVRASAEAATMLGEQSKIRARFAGLIAGTPLGGGGITPSLYWDMFEVEGDAHVSLGALYGRANAGGWQGVDINYFATGGFFVHLTFFEFWPVQIGNSAATLVWRGDLLSSASLASLRGVERSGAGTVMMRQLQKGAALFQKDASGER
ncbi:MAG: hypothetical protein JWL90_3199 [Chthoniobacteraceae bacterium]|nr:hypothetical protein [Chthoniobacteraceae bacterium]